MIVKFRKAAAYATGVTALTWGGIGLLVAQPKVYEYDAVQNEQRLTSVEIRLDTALQQLKEIRDTQGKTEYASYLELLMLGGLGIEAGNRIRRKKQSGSAE